MSTARRPMSEDGLSHVVGHWLAEGPSAAPEALVESALRSAATTRQLRPLPRVLRMVSSRSPAVAMGLAGAALAAGMLAVVGLGLGDDNQPGIVPTPSPGESAEGQGLPQRFVTYRNEAGGYELAVPASWRVWEQPDGRYVRFTNPSPGDRGPRHENASALFFSVSVGTEEGEIALRCSHCTTTARTMDELEAAITTYAPDAAPGTASATPQSTTMDGLDARVLYPVIGATGWMAGGVCHAYAFSGSRPIVLTLECEYFHGFPNNAGLLRDIIDSFRFLDGASSEAELVTHQYAEPGFSVDLPAAWKVAEATGTITAQGTGGTLRVKAGSSGGQISPCGLVAGHPCSDASRTWDAVASGESDSSATTRLADSLAEVLERDWDIAPLLGRVLVRESTSLGEADAIRLRLDGQYCPSDCTWRYVVAVRGGQPWVIAYQPDDMVPRLFADILPTFRFLGDAPEADSEWVGQAIRDQAAGFEIRVPRFWTVNSSPGTFHMRDNGTSLTIRIGDADGRLVTCQTPARPWERCRDVQITNLEEFRDAVATGPPEGCGWCIPGATNTSSTLGGEAAWRIAFFGYEYPAQSSETALYVLALHDGRPFFIRFHTSANGPQEGRRALWDEILETVRFLP